jgi:RNA polymerase sigma-70 factor (ECF subfamily)
MTEDRFSVEELLGQSIWLRRLAGTLVAGEAAAEDLVQETWLAALRHPPASDRPLRPWLGRVARNLASRFRRSEARRSAYESESGAAEPAPDASSLTGEVEAQRILAEAVLRLEEPLRAVVVMRYMRGEDSRAIGRQLGVPDGTVRWRLKRALELLREDLDRRFDGDRRTWCAAFAGLLPRSSSPPLGRPPPSFSTGTWLMSTSTKIALALTAAALATWIVTREKTPAHAPAESVRMPSDERSAAAAPPLEHALPAPAERAPVAVAATALVEPVPAECCVVGRVLDPEGRGLAGARVLARASRLDGSTLRAAIDETPAPSVTTSGEHGLFSLPLPASRPFVLAAEHPSFAPVAHPTVFAGERHDLTLLSGSLLIVAVRSSARAPSAGAEVRVRVPGPDKSGDLWSRAGKTGADGTISFTGLPAGKASVEARCGVERGERLVEISGVETDGREPARCEVELRATGRIEGIVRDRATGQPIAGARVGSPYHDVPEVTTDALGRYALAGIGLGEGFWSLGAHARGYAFRFELLKLPPDAPERALDFGLEPAASVSGRVLGPDRRALAGARLVFLATLPIEPYTATTDRLETSSGDGGRFTLAELHPDVAYRVLVLAAGHATGVFACGPFAGGASVELEEFVLAPGGSLAGNVPEGANAESFLVRLYWAGDEGEHLSALETHLETTRADPRGRFAFDGLAPGRYRLALVDPAARRSHASSAELAEIRVELRAGEERRGLAFRPGESSVAGKVLGPGGRGVQTCRVGLFALAAPEEELATASTDRDGTFRLHVEAPGPFRLVVEDRQLLLESRVLEPVELGSTDIVLELGEFHSAFEIRGELVLESGELPEGVYVGFRDVRTGERLQRVAIPEFDGAFTMRNLRDEAYDLELVDVAGLFEPVRLAGVRPGAEDVELRLVPRK